MNRVKWYVDWFNSPYYHLLYNNRDNKEADFFITHICEELKLQPHASLWDVACGKGRHAIAFNKKGFNVIGTDLSENSIAEALQYKNTSLDFFVHDMRHAFRSNQFDAAFNLFTSMGYFENKQDNALVFQSVARALKKNACFVIDFFNSESIFDAVFANEYVERRGDINFAIRKKIMNDKIVKQIEVQDKNKIYQFEETVSLLRKNDFESFSAQAGLELVNVFGNYHLEPFSEKESERLILVFKK